jgi:alpha-glucosidase
VLAYIRSHAGERLLCAFNLSDRPAALALPAGVQVAEALPDSGAAGAAPQPAAIAFEPWGVLLARLA